jgi:hypothetical protein
MEGRRAWMDGCYPGGGGGLSGRPGPGFGLLKPPVGGALVGAGERDAGRGSGRETLRVSVVMRRHGPYDKPRRTG